jgi:two-component system response regulator MprA
VLVVEDDHEILVAVNEILTEAGYQVAGARHGQEALDYLAANPVPSAIVVDLLMPRMNGWDLVNRLRADSRLADTPVVIVTATGPHWGYPVDASLVVRKPFQRQHLLELIQRVTAPRAPGDSPPGPPRA